MQILLYFTYMIITGWCWFSLKYYNLLSIGCCNLSKEIYFPHFNTTKRTLNLVYGLGSTDCSPVAVDYIVLSYSDKFYHKIITSKLDLAYSVIQQPLAGYSGTWPLSQTFPQSPWYKNNILQPDQSY